MDDLRRALEKFAGNEDWRGVALTAAAMWQALDDAMGRTTMPLTTAAGKARRRSDAVGKGASLMADSVLRLATPGRWSTGPSVAQWRTVLVEIAARAAVLAVDEAEPRADRAGARDAEPDGAGGETLARTTAALVAELGAPPSAVRAAVARIPSCFRSFDQHPDDICELVDRFAARWPERTRPLVVVGVRTSGSYLAPFALARLRRAGFRDISMVSGRPGVRYAGADIRGLRTVAQNNGAALVIDDPPATGNAVAEVCSELAEFGFSRRSIIPLLALFADSPTLPAPLAEYDAITLPWAQWSVHRRLTPGRVAADLSTALRPATVEILEELHAPDHLPRTHARRLYRVQIRHESGRTETRTVLARGSGQGHFGDYDVEVACALKRRVPTVLARADGVLYLEWPCDPRPTLPTGAQVADYIAARHDTLPVAHDAAGLLRGCQPVWEVASNHIARVYGRHWALARIALVDRLTQHLLRTASPSVPDGDMRPPTWLIGSRDDQPVKTSFTERTFSNFDLVCFDDRFDVVGAAVHTDVAEYTRELQTSYESRTDRVISPERWLLYELVHLWDLERLGSASPAGTRIRKTKAMRRYLAAALLPDLDRLAGDPPTGPVVALDVDGVLETDLLGFKAPTPTAVLALRALHAHGYRTVLATGRSLDDVVDLSTAFGLTGGAAEYGAVTYHHPTRTVASRIDDDQQAVLEQLRGRLDDRPGVQLDPRHRHSVRASAIEGNRLRAYHPPAELLPAGVSAVRGEEQTDFVPTGTDKAGGLRDLLHDLGESVPALAVGDTAADAAFLTWAALSVAPRHADPQARAAATHTASRPYQAGLADAVGRLIGHRPGRCSLCAPPHMTADTETLLALLRVSERTRLHALYRTVPLLRLRPAG